jgi:membrane protease YdiL (CAAX protease family)
MLLGVWFDFGLNSYIIDAIIGFSVVYKALDNLGAFQRWFGVQPDTRIATLIFGLLHGFGLASKILDYDIAPEGLWVNLLSFNVGVEIGQLLALAAILAVMTRWRRRPAFVRQAYAVNVLMMTAGFALMGYQIAGYVLA